MNAPRRPSFENKVNLNTILLALGILGSGAAWGMTWQSMQSGQAANAGAIARLQKDIDSLKAESRSFSSLQYRVAVLETGAVVTTQSLKDLDRALAQLASDVRVTREIVERMDRARSGRDAGRN